MKVLSKRPTLPFQGDRQPGYLKLQRAFFAVCLIGGPLLMMLSVFVNPDKNVNSNSGSAVIAARIVDGPGLSPLDILFMTELFLLPCGILGMTVLAMRTTPWLASIGGFLSITGLMAFSVFVGQTVQSRLMAQMGGGVQLVDLWDRFNSDPVITLCLYIAIIGFFLIGPMLLGIGLGRAGLIPMWATWVFILRAPIQAVGFASHIGLSIEYVTFGLLLIGNIPVALALLKFSDEKAAVHSGEQSASAS